MKGKPPEKWADDLHLTPDEIEQAKLPPIVRINQLRIQRSPQKGK